MIKYFNDKNSENIKWIKIEEFYYFEDEGHPYYPMHKRYSGTKIIWQKGNKIFNKNFKCELSIEQAESIVFEKYRNGLLSKIKSIFKKENK